MAGDGRDVDVKFGEQRRGENLGTRAGLGEQGENGYRCVLLAIHADGCGGYGKFVLLVEKRMAWDNSDRGDRYGEDVGETHLLNLSC